MAVDKPSITIEHQIEQLRTLIDSKDLIQFRDILTDNFSWTEVAVSLLAVLELVKRHEIDALQAELFGPIEIQRRGPSK